MSRTKYILLIVEAEHHTAMKDFDKAESCYDASIKAAREEHRFIPKRLQWQTNLLGFSTWKGGNATHSYFKSSLSCYQIWGGVPLL